MNLLFLLLFLLGGCAMAFLSPENFLPTLLKAGERAGALCVSLVASYGVWMGLMQVMTDCRLSDKLSRGLKPLTQRLFLMRDEKAVQALTMNLSANLLGLSGLATPYGIRAVEESEGKQNGAFTQSMLFVISATSLQVLPTTAISLLTLHGAKDPYAIFLPTLLSTALSTAVGIALVFLLCRRRKNHRA